MTDPAQLKLTARTGFARTLLESAQGDHSAPGAAQRALLAVGFGASAATLAASASASTTAGSSVGMGGKWAGVLIVKWLGLGLLAGSTTLLSLDYVTRDERALSTTHQAATATPLSAPRLNRADTVPHETPLSSATSDLLAPPSEVLRRAASAPPLLTQPERVEPTAGPAADPLAELQAVRGALATHQPQRALTLLDAFEREAASASLAEEASVLRIEALLDTRRPEAAKLGADFLRQYPRSAYAPRVRAKLHLP